jgi:hypothetical protein
MTLFTPEINKLFEDNTPSPKSDKDKKPLISPEMEKLFGNTTPLSSKTAESDVVQKFQEMPWYGQAWQATDDLARLFGTGAMYGSDAVMGGEETARLNDEARQRASYPGMIAEFGGTLASPVTRVIGAGAKAIAPVGKGLWNWLGRAAVTSGEGAAIGGTGAVLSGRPEDAYNDATLGAVLPHAIKAGGKAISFPAKHAASYAAGRKPANYSKAFDVGRTGDPDVVMAFRRGMSGKKIHPQSPRPMRSAWVAGKNLSQIRPSKGSVGTAVNAIWPAYFIDPTLIGTALGALTLGSPRLGGTVAHGIGGVLGGLDMLGSKGQLPAITYEQYQRQKKRKD